MSTAACPYSDVLLCSAKLAEAGWKNYRSFIAIAILASCRNFGKKVLEMFNMSSAGYV
jgi:hypothetical protein